MGKKNARLENRLILMKPVKDDFGEFIPYCAYEHHKGIIKHNHYLQCEKRACCYYFQLYLINHQLIFS